MEPIELKTVRPFILESLSLANTNIHPQDNEMVESYLTSKVEDLVEKAKVNRHNDKLPLVRLKVRLRGPGYYTPSTHHTYCMGVFTHTHTQYQCLIQKGRVKQWDFFPFSYNFLPPSPLSCLNYIIKPCTLYVYTYAHIQVG